METKLKDKNGLSAQPADFWGFVEPIELRALIQNKVFRKIGFKDRRTFVLHLPANMVNGFVPIERVSIVSAVCTATKKCYLLIGLNEKEEKVDA